MADLSTTYLGLSLRSPVVVASSRLTMQLKGLKKSEEAGAGAVVLKSIFEEQIDFDSRSMIQDMDAFSVHADGFDFLENTSKDFYIDKYLELVENAKKALSIPVIPSVNCLNPGSWIDYSHRFEEVGADALELNVYIPPTSTAVSSEEIEAQYLELIGKVREKVSIPVAVKLGYHFSSLANFMKKLDELGVNALVLFNRYYRPDIDIEKVAMAPGKIVSVQEESALSLQWTGLLSGELSCDLCSNTGIHSGESVIKHLLSGASAVQVCSAVMKSGYSVIDSMNKELAAWMDRKNYASIEDFKGALNRENTSDSGYWERAQYIKAISGIA